MKFATIPLHQFHAIAPDNPLGAVGAFAAGGAEAVVKVIEPVLDKIDGVVLQRFHGCLDESKEVGYQPDGDRIFTEVCGPEDRLLTDDEIDVWRKLAKQTRVVIYGGLPRGIAGFDGLDRTCLIEPWGYALDVAGQNEHALAWQSHRTINRNLGISNSLGAVGSIPEPTPLPQNKPTHWTAQYTTALEERWRTLLKVDALPKRGMVHFNGNKDGSSYWHPKRAEAWQQMGLDVCAPAKLLVPGSMDGGVE